MSRKLEGKSSKYFGVCKIKNPKTRAGRPSIFLFHACFRTPEGNWSKYYKTERQAAIAVDMKLIEMGKPPRNILKPAK